MIFKEIIATYSEYHIKINKICGQITVLNNFKSMLYPCRLHWA